jgi:hypothetical protein
MYSGKITYIRNKPDANQSLEGTRHKGQEQGTRFKIQGRYKGQGRSGRCKAEGTRKTRCDLQKIKNPAQAAGLVLKE